MEFFSFFLSFSYFSGKQKELICIECLKCPSLIISIVDICTYFILKLTNGFGAISIVYMRKLSHGINCLTNLIKVILQISGKIWIPVQAVCVQSGAIR